MRYELLELIGKGGMGEVWKARDPGLGRIIAVKRLQRTSPEDLARFRREAQVTARLNHPGIAQVYEFGENYIAMQYVDGTPCDQRPATRDPQRVQALRDAARAVQFAHENGVLHRDLKPANILVDGAGRAYVLDFGLAREVRGDATAMSLTGDILGTPSFLAPEQARGDIRSLDARTDVYGLGATLYALLAGRPPHTGATAFDVVAKVIEEDPAPPGGDPDLQTICLKALEKDPARRYATAEDFATDLDRWLRDEPIVARPASTLYRWRKRIARRPVVWSLAALLALALTGGAAFGVIQQARRLVAESAALHEAERRLNLAEAQRLVDDARARLADVQAALYIEGCSLTRYMDSLQWVRRVCLEALERVPDSVPALFWLARCHRLESDLGEAIATLERATRGEAPSYVWIELGRARMMRAIEETFLYTGTNESPEWRRAQIESAMEAFESAGLTTGVDAAVVALMRLFAEGDEERIPEAADEALARLRVIPGVEEIEFVRGLAMTDADALTRAISLRPGFFEAWFMRAVFRHSHLDDVDGAIRDLDRALEIQPRHYPSLVQRGGLKFNLGRLEEAEADFTRAIEVDPGPFHGWGNRARVRADRGNYVDAEADYTEAIERLPENAGFWSSRAALRHMVGDAAGAMADLERALTLDPGLAAAYRNRALLWRDLGALDRARADADRGVALAPEDALSWGARAQVRIAAEDWAGAEEDLTQVLERNPGNATAWLQRAGLRAQREDWLGAERDATRGLDLAEGTEVDYSFRARVRAALGNWAGAVEDYTRAMEFAAEEASYWNDRGNARANMGDIEGALEDYAQALALAPGLTQAHVNRGWTHLERQDAAAALRDAEAALQGAPNDREARYLRASIRFARGEYDGAEEDFAAMLAAGPDARAYQDRAAMRTMAGDDEGALADYEAMIATWPERPEGYAGRGTVRYNRGEYDGAAADFEEALRRAPADWGYREWVEERLREIEGMER